MIKKRIKKWFTLIWITIYMVILWTIIIPWYLFVNSLITKTYGQLNFKENISYIGTLFNNRTPLILYYNTRKNVSSWKVYSNHTVYWKNYGDTFTKSDIMNLDIVKNNSYNYPYLTNSNNKINLFIVTSDYFWQQNVNFIRNILITWSYKDTWFYCSGIEVINNTDTVTYRKLKCEKGQTIVVSKVIKENVLDAYYDYQREYWKNFNIIMWITNKDNNF